MYASDVRHVCVHPIANRYCKVRGFTHEAGIDEVLSAQLLVALVARSCKCDYRAGCEHVAEVLRLAGFSFDIEVKRILVGVEKVWVG